jgi:Protein of unknown function (DUF2782)
MRSTRVVPEIVLIITLAAASALTFNLALAQQDDAGPADKKQDKTDPAAPPPIPPIPPKVPNEEVELSVVITEKEGERIEEYSRDGRVYMVKITPIKGPPYWYLDEDGDGQLELSDPDNGQGPVRPVFWKLKEW